MNRKFYNKIIKYIYLCLRFDLSIDEIKSLETEIQLRLETEISINN
jgi:hypothetical protein